MSEFHKKLALAVQMLDTATKSLQSAKVMIAELAGGNESVKNNFLESQMAQLEGSDEENVIEGVFNGEKMEGEDGETYPVPANYASKSKLVVGDALKLTIAPNGSFIYKQIGPVDRDRLLGTLVKEDGKYFGMAGGKLYRLLTAAVTYHRAEIGDKLSLHIPVDGDVEWAALEHVLPDGELPDEELNAETF